MLQIVYKKTSRFVRDYSPATDPGRTVRTSLYPPVQAPPPPPPPHTHTSSPFVPVPDRETVTCVRDRRALQQLAMNMHVKHSDLT